MILLVVNNIEEDLNFKISVFDVFEKLFVKPIENIENIKSYIQHIIFLIEYDKMFMSQGEYSKLFQLSHLVMNMRLDKNLRLLGFDFMEKLLSSYHNFFCKDLFQFNMFCKFLFLNTLKSFLNEKWPIFILKKIKFLKNLVSNNKQELIELQEVDFFYQSLNEIINNKWFFCTLTFPNFKEEFFYFLSEFIFEFCKTHKEHSKTILYRIYNDYIEKLLRKELTDKNILDFSFLLMVNHFQLELDFFKRKSKLYLNILKIITYYSNQHENEKFLLIGNFSIGMLANVIDKDIEKFFPFFIEVLDKNINYFSTKPDSKMKFVILDNITSALGKVIHKSFFHMYMKKNYSENLIKIWISKLPLLHDAKEAVISTKILFRIFKIYETSNSDFMNYFLKKFLDILYETYNSEVNFDSDLKRKIKKKLMQYNIFVK